jgi:hypothetical protein
MILITTGIALYEFKVYLNLKVLLPFENRLEALRKPSETFRWLTIRLTPLKETTNQGRPNKINIFVD